MSNRSTAARRANQTRTARRQFRTMYPKTAHLAEGLLNGWTSHEVAQDYEVPVSVVAAVAANLNRPGDYAEFARRCNY